MAEIKLYDGYQLVGRKKSPVPTIYEFLDKIDRSFFFSLLDDTTKNRMNRYADIFNEQTGYNIKFEFLEDGTVNVLNVPSYVEIRTMKLNNSIKRIYHEKTNTR